MADLTPQDMAANLLASGFERNGPSAAALSDPIADTPMVVTLDQLRPYDHDPRVTRNPAYEDIKASIRERGRWMRRPRSRAGPASRTTSSATVATRAWRSCASCGARRRTNSSSASPACSARGRSVAKW